MRRLRHLAMLSVAAIFWTMFPARSADQSYVSMAEEMPIAEQKALEKKAKAGDGAAAYRLYCGLTDDHGLEAFQSALPWLLLAIRLHNDEAERLFAMSIGEFGDVYRAFGETPAKARENLLQESAKTYGLSCDDLGQDYESGYFGKKDDVHAREYYLRGAEFNIEFCWTPLAKLYHESLGGPRDDRAAYYWISLDANCVSPDSMSGEEIWKLREKIAAQLPLSDLREEWKKIDHRLNKIRFGTIKVYPAPFLFGYIKESESRDARHRSLSKESEHRQRLEKRG